MFETLLALCLAYCPGLDMAINMQGLRRVGFPGITEHCLTESGFQTDLVVPGDRVRLHHLYLRRNEKIRHPKDPWWLVRSRNLLLIPLHSLHLSFCRVKPLFKILYNTWFNLLPGILRLSSNRKMGPNEIRKTKKYIFDYIFGLKFFF